MYNQLQAPPVQNYASQPSLPVDSSYPEFGWGFCLKYHTNVSSFSRFFCLQLRSI